MKKVVYLTLLGFSFVGLAQTTTENFIKTTVYNGPNNTLPVTLVTYFDGLGRPIQQVAGQQSASGQDIVIIPYMMLSGDKAKAYGSNDFWVIKLKDKSKKVETPKLLEAIPNPANSFTNIIVGYDFATGTATVTDMMGRQLQSLNINSRTIPVDLSGHPAGVYVINVVTANANESIKV